METPATATRGRLIVLEGIDGTGKTTLSARLAAALRDAGRRVVETREPWTSPAGQELRRVLAAKERTTTGTQELELFHADRAAHVAAVVAPALARGDWVVQDRTFWSTAAYQGARGIDVAAILARSAAIAPMPDLTVLLQLSPEAALERIAANRAGTSSFEKLGDLRAVAKVYGELAAAHPEFERIDAAAPLEQVTRELFAACRRRLGAP
ncbi:MAG: dTMP kinase [Planctomycetes bacterium]|nr:dTMP kinase [Planctomycetota bacterium]